MPKEYIKRKHIIATYVNRGIEIVRGNGIFLYDNLGQEYLDLMSNYGVNIFGYNHKDLNRNLSEQLEKLPTLHGSFLNNIRDQASTALVERCGPKYAQVYWSNSGSEAIEAALKFAVVYKKKKKFLVCKNGYHGKTLGALSATSGEKYKKDFLPLLWDFVEIPFGDIQALRDGIDENTAGFILEPILGEGGIISPKDDYLIQVRELCTQKDILLIIDEIQTGAGRTGEFLVSQKHGVNGDILCLGKGLAGGIPVGATLMSKTVAESIPRSIHTSTFGGNPLACQGVLTVLDLLTQETCAHIRETGEYFKEKLKTLDSNLIISVLGEGFMLGFKVKEHRNDILKKLQREKILAIPSAEDVVRFLPPYLLRKKQIDTVIEKLKKILNEF